MSKEINLEGYRLAHTMIRVKDLGTAKYKKSALGKTLLILSILITSLHPSTVFPLLLTPI